MNSPEPSTISKAVRAVRDNIRVDAAAGLTVAVMGVPQAMAYALIAGLPPMYGLYTAITPCLIAALFGSSNHLVTGPTNAMCMVILSLTVDFPERFGVSAIEVVLALTFLTGGFQLLFGVLKLGGVVKYVSNSVVVGFTAGAGLLIAANQFKNLMGVKIDSSQGGHFFATLWATAQQVHHTNPFALAVGLLTIAIVAGFRWRLPRVPGSLVAVVAVTALAAAAGWFGDGMGPQRVQIIRDIEEIRPSFDFFQLPQMFVRPDFALWSELATGALALAILGLVESASIARSIAASSGQRLDFTREFKSQGIANMVGVFFHSFAASGSFTRSAVCYQSGARTRMAAIFSAIFTAVIFLAFGPLANFIPQASLAGILMVIAFTMLEKERLAMTWRSGSNSRTVLAGTFAATLLMPLETAIFAGVMLSIVILLRITGKPDLTQLVQHPDYGFEEVPFNRAAPAPVAIINLEGDLYFAAADDLDYELLSALKPETRVVILRMKRLRAVGSSAMAMLEHFHHLLHERRLHLIICGIEDEMKDVLTGSGVRKLIGEQNIFYADNRIFQSTELALARARVIVEMQRARSEDAAAVVQQEALVATTAADLMQRRCLRFGSEHQVREAMWLVSQFQRRMNTIHPQTVFLQNREGKLVAELSLRSILRDLASAVPEDKAPTMDDGALARCLQSRLYESVKTIARAEPVTLRHDSPLAEVFSHSGQRGFRPMPVSDAHGRLSGVFDEMAMMRALTKLLQAEQTRREGPPSLDEPAAAPETTPA